MTNRKSIRYSGTPGNSSADPRAAQQGVKLPRIKKGDNKR